MSRFTTAAIQRYRRTFDVFDRDGDGVINAIELQQIAHKLGYRLSDIQVAKIMASRDLDKSGDLSFEEFLNAMPGNLVDIPEEDHNREAEIRLKFLEFDKDGNGLVSAAEAHEILEQELAFKPSQTLALLKRYDRNKDGHLSYEEFVQFYKRVKSRKAELEALFHQCDLDKDGSVSVEEIKHVLSRCKIPADDVEILVALHDKNKDGRLQYEEFVHFILDGE